MNRKARKQSGITMKQAWKLGYFHGGENVSPTKEWFPAANILRSTGTRVMENENGSSVLSVPYSMVITFGKPNQRFSPKIQRAAPSNVIVMPLRKAS